MESIDIEAYQKIKKEVVKEFAEHLIRYYTALRGTTCAAMVVYRIQLEVDKICGE